MTPERWQRLKELFLAADQLPSGEQPGFLSSNCNDDPELLAEALGMLAGSRNPVALLPADPGLLAAQMLGDVRDDPYLGRVFGEYYFRSRLAVGGMSWVYLAERADCNMLVAVKVLRDAMSTERRELFDYERRILAQMKHPGIARLYDAGELDDGAAFFAMEYVDGVPITEYCRQHALTLKQRLSLFRQVCDAVRYAHELTIIHRDLKPSNILVQGDGTAKLLDFGVSERISEVRKSSQSSSYMTLVYAAPEQIRHERATMQADIYSLGVILQQLLTGHLPFDIADRTMPEIRSIVLEQRPRTPSAVIQASQKRLGADNEQTDPGVDPTAAGRLDWQDFDHICATALARNPADRYGSVETLIRQLDLFAQRKPLDGREQQHTYAAARFLQRHRRSVSIATALAFCIAGLVTFYTDRLTRARNAAVAEAAKTERVEQFMENLMSGGDPDNGPADDLRVVTILDRGVRDAKSLDTDPPIQARLYQTLAGIYTVRGNFGVAEALFHSALESEVKLYGEDSSQYAGTLASFAMLRRQEGKTGDAEQTMRRALAIDRRKLSADDPQVTEIGISLGLILIDHGANREAIGILEKAVEFEAGKKGSAAYLSLALSNLAMACFYDGQLERSRQLSERALVIDRKLKGDENIDIAEDLMSIAEQDERFGHLAKAEQEERQAFAIEQHWYRNEDHSAVASALTILAQTLGKEQKYEEGLPLVEQALAMRLRMHEPPDAQFAHTWNAIGSINEKLGHLDEAAKEQTEALRMYKAIYPGQSYQAGICLDELADNKYALKQYSAADRLSQEALQMLTAKLPADDVIIATAETHYGRSLAAQHRLNEAKHEYLAAYSILISRKEPRSEEIANLRRYLSSLYQTKHDPAKAG